MSDQSDAVTEVTRESQIEELTGLDGPGWLLVVDPEGSGERLDRFIARRLTRVSRSRAAKLSVSLLDDIGLVTQVRLKKSARLSSGQRLWVRRPLPPEDMASLSAPHLIEKSQDFIVIDKPPGWVAHPTASHYQSALTTWLKNQNIQAYPAHRLDLETSGVILCTRSHEVDIEVRQSFGSREVYKRYLAICEVTERGMTHLNVHPKSWCDRTPLGFDIQSQVGLKMGIGALKAQTEFKVIHYHQTLARLLVEARPVTGRQHQIRAHLALVGLPLVGDKLYGHSEDLFLRHLDGALGEEDWSLLGHHRHALHASELSLNWRGRRLTWVSPLPPDLRALIPHTLLSNDLS